LLLLFGLGFFDRDLKAAKVIDTQPPYKSGSFIMFVSDFVVISLSLWGFVGGIIKCVEETAILVVRRDDCYEVTTDDISIGYEQDNIIKREYGIFGSSV